MFHTGAGTISEGLHAREALYSVNNWFWANSVFIRIFAGFQSIDQVSVSYSF